MAALHREMVFEKSHHQKKEHTKRKNIKTTVAPSQTPSILHLLDGYHFMT
jgi:hypothetical protein